MIYPATESDLAVAPALTKESVTAWFDNVYQNHRPAIQFDLTEWDNCFGNLYAGWTNKAPKFWSYITQIIHTTIGVIKINVCVSVALLNHGDHVTIDYMFDNNNSCSITLNDEDLLTALNISVSSFNELVKHVQYSIPDFQGLDTILNNYMNANNYAERWNKVTDF